MSKAPVLDAALERAVCALEATFLLKPAQKIPRDEIKAALLDVVRAVMAEEAQK